MRPTRNLVSARATPAKPTLRMASRFRTGLAPGGVCLAPLVTEGAVRFYRTVSPVPDALRRRAVCSLLHFPSSHLDWPLASTLPCGARTFLDGRPKATAATTCPARARSEPSVPPNRRRDDRDGARPLRPGYVLAACRGPHRSMVLFLASALVGCATRAGQTLSRPRAAPAGPSRPHRVECWRGRQSGAGRRRLRFHVPLRAGFVRQTGTERGRRSCRAGLHPAARSS